MFYWNTHGVIGVLNSHDIVGRIVETASPTNFIFVSSKEKHPPKFEYVVVKSRELVDGEYQNVLVLAVVEGVLSKSSVYTDSLNLQIAEKIWQAGIDDSNVLCEAKTLGFLYKDKKGNTKILMPRSAIYPGNEVYLAPDEYVSKFFSFTPEEGLHIGYLVSRPHIPVYVSLNGFRRHVAILAQTGAGKSYTAGVLLEELIKKGATVVVIDPHADYVFLSRNKDGNRFDYYRNITVFRNPNSTGRYSRDDIDNLMDYIINFTELSPDEVCAILGIPLSYRKIIRAVEEAINRLRSQGEPYNYTPQDLIDIIDDMAKNEKNTDLRDGAFKAKFFVKKLEKLRVFGMTSTDIKRILKPSHVSIIDLSGLNDESMDFIASRLLSKIYYMVTSGEFNYPVFVIVEEAHKFVPPKSKELFSYSRDIINTIAAEGRKFGIFLILISQRPSKIDSDSLSQCNSQIILRITNPLDQTAVQQSSERVSEDLLEDLPGLNIGEAVIVGELVRVPVIVKIRERITKEGGSDINVVNMLKMAREEAGLEDRIREEYKNLEKPEDDSYSEV